MSDAGASADILASDAERDAAMSRLRDAAGEGRLTLEELADRLDAVGAARTRGQLAELTRDLPEAAPGPRRVAATTPRVRNSAVFGDQRRSGAWIVPAEGRWESLFGDVKLDLREAQVAADEMRIDAGTVFGDIELLVPEGIVVDVRARTLFGDVRQEAGEVGAPGAPRVTLTGGTVFGDVRVRHHRLRERLLDRWRGREP